MTKQQIFKAAHALAKTFVGSYVACFALALKTVYAELKAGVKKMKTIFEIVETLKTNGYKYYGNMPKAWQSQDGSISRIYFGSDYVTVEGDKAHSNRSGKSRAQTIGESAVKAVIAAM